MEDFQIHILTTKTITQITIPRDLKERLLLSLDVENKRHKIAYLISTERRYFLQMIGDKKQQEIQENAIQYAYIKEVGKVVILLKKVNEDNQIYHHYDFKEQSIIYIGRDKQNEIHLPFVYISKRHACLYKKEGIYYIEDQDSRNYLYVNNKRCRKQKLVMGDMIYIMGFTIIIGSNFIAMNHLQYIHFNKTIFFKEDIQPFQEMVSLEKIFYPSIHQPLDISIQEIQIEPPEIMNEIERMPFLYAMGPSISMSFMTILGSMMTLLQMHTQNAALLQVLPTVFMSISMAMGMMLWPLLTRMYERKRHKYKVKYRQETYRLYLAKMNEQINQKILNIQNKYHEHYPDIQVLIQYISKQDKNLWKVNSMHSDFLNIKIGMGDIKAPIHLQYEVFSAMKQLDDVEKQYVIFTQQEFFLKDAPYILSLKKYQRIAIVSSRVVAIFQYWMLQLVALHHPKQLQVIVLNCPPQLQLWLRYFPHCYTEDHRCFILKDEEHILEMQEYIEHHCDHKYICLFHFKYLQEAFPLIQEMENLTYIECCTSSHIVGANNAVVITDHFTKSSIHYVKDDIKDTFMMPSVEPYEHHMHGSFLLNLKEMRGQQNNKEYSFLDLYRIGNIESFAIQQTWKQSDPIHSLAVPIGRNEQGEKIYLDIHEAEHGPHGIIAGMTGSGKSEFLNAYILSLALHYAPWEVNLVLIDYKGGTMAKTFSKIPHVISILTNLDTSMMARALFALENELRRRQTLLNQASKDMNISNLDIYEYQKLFREQKIEKPLAHLCIIADEFAELKLQYPEFIKKLVQIARIGRSLGIHLLLATQKPTGTVDEQIFSNSRFHICLKVQNRSDSLDMLKREDAVYLKQPGEFFLQVGHNEVFQYGYAPYTQASYEAKPYYDDAGKQLCILLDDIGNPIYQVEIGHHQNKTKQIDEFCRYLQTISNEIPYPISSLWKEEPHIKTLTELEDIYQEQMILGEIDNIYEQRHEPFMIKKLQHTIIYSSKQKERSNFFKLLCTQLVKCHQYVYILDFDHMNMETYISTWKGANIKPRQTSRVHYFFHHIKKMMKSNQEPISIMICGYENFIELYPEYEKDILYLLREGELHHIGVYISASTMNNMHYHTLQYINEKYVLYMHDIKEYSSTLQISYDLEYTMKETKGYMLYKQKVMQFQLARLSDHVLIEQQTCLPEYRIPEIPTILTSTYIDTYEYQQQFTIGIYDAHKHFYHLNLQKDVFTLICPKSLLEDFRQTIERELKRIKQDYDYENDNGIQLKNISSIKKDRDYPHVTILLLSQEELDIGMKETRLQQRIQEGYVMWVGSGFYEMMYEWKHNIQPVAFMQLKKHQAYMMYDHQVDMIQYVEKEAEMIGFN